jgi:hypothetical protein
MQYGKIESGVVVSVMQATYTPDAPWQVVPDHVGPGWTVDEGVYSEPVVPAVARTRLTRLEFRSQFTQSELQAIYTARAASVDIQIYLDNLNAAQFIELSDARTITGVQALESGGLIGTGRAAEILTGVTE